MSSPLGALGGVVWADVPRGIATDIVAGTKYLLDGYGTYGICLGWLVDEANAKAHISSYRIATNGYPVFAAQGLLTAAANKRVNNLYAILAVAADDIGHDVCDGGSVQPNFDPVVAVAVDMIALDNYICVSVEVDSVVTVRNELAVQYLSLGAGKIDAIRVVGFDQVLYTKMVLRGPP